MWDCVVLKIYINVLSSSSSLAFFAYRSACTNMQMHIYIYIYIYIYIIYIHSTFKHSAARITRIGQAFREYLQV